MKLYESAGKKITLSSVSNYETGLHLPSPQALPAIADILKVSIDALFNVEKETATTEKKLIVPQGELAQWQQELKNIEQEFNFLKRKEADALQKEAMPVAEYCDRVIKLAKKQQDELLVLQNELTTIRNLVSLMSRSSEPT